MYIFLKKPVKSHIVRYTDKSQCNPSNLENVSGKCFSKMFVQLIINLLKSFVV